jgi:hypothetical protein
MNATIGLRRHVKCTLTCHHLRPVFQGKLVSKPALTILPLIPAPSKRPNTVRRNKVTTSWSRGESRSGRMQIVQLVCLNRVAQLMGETEFYIRKQRASTSPSLPVAVSGSVSPREAPAQIGRFWFRHHCFVQERHGLEGLSGMFRRRMVEFRPKHMPVIRMRIKNKQGTAGRFSVSVCRYPHLQKLVASHLFFLSAAAAVGS